jgi:hypothetical protein
LKEKRTNPFVEMQDEAKQKRRKKQTEPKNPQKPKPKKESRKKKCTYCGDEDHITVKECKYMRISLSREAEIVREQI